IPNLLTSPMHRNPARNQDLTQASRNRCAAFHKLVAGTNLNTMFFRRRRASMLTRSARLPAERYTSYPRRLFMAAYTTGEIRNIALIGHHSAGKTTLGDAILFASGATNRMGDVAAKSSHLDFM